MGDLKWYELENPNDLVSPSLLLYPDRIRRNIETMIEIAGDVDRLRPHVKTYKIAEIIQMQLEYGISKFKCATIAEAELIAQSGGKDVLLAHQPVGNNINRLLELIENYPDVFFSAIVDNKGTALDIASIAETEGVIAALWIDINNGMNRTGITPNEGAIQLYKMVHEHSNLTVEGLHVYDGHFRDSNFETRKRKCDEAFEKVLHLIRLLNKDGYDVRNVVVGGSPTFPVHAKRKNAQLSPGTTLLWDAGYSDILPDLNFLPAAVLLGQVISKPGEDKICLNLGHKSIAAEMPFPRAEILNISNSVQIKHSEEHLVLECPNVEDYDVGQICYAIPMHICPTVAKYDTALTVGNGVVTGSWKVAARDYKINI